LPKDAGKIVSERIKSRGYMSGGYSPDICGSVLNTACMCY